MTISLKISLIILLIFQLYLIIKIVRRKKLTMKYASFWIFLIVCMFFVVIFPNIIYKLSEFAGFEKTSNMIFLLGFFFLFYISFIITTSISVQNMRIKSLIQELSILKESVKKDGKEK